MTNKKNWHSELEKFKNMTWPDRVWYIWEYYKLGIFGILLTIFLLYEAGACIYRNLQDTMLYCVTINETQVTHAQMQPVQTEFEALQGYDQTWRQNTEFDVSLSIDDSNKAYQDQYYSTASNLKFESLVATHTIDVLITVPNMRTFYTSQNLFLDLEDILPSDFYQELLSEDRIVFEPDYNGNTIASGILLTDSYLSDRIPLEEASTISVCTLDNHPEAILDFIHYVLDGSITK